MELIERKEDNVLVIQMSGRLDTSNYATAEKKITAFIDGGEKHCLFDCSRLDYISSSGLRVLLVALKKLTQEGGKMVLCCLNENISEIFEIAGFNTIFTIEDDIDKGLTLFK